MTTYAITLVNGGAELGNTSGWVDAGGSGSFTVTSNGADVHDGTYAFDMTGSLNDLGSNMAQTVTITDPSLLDVIAQGCVLNVTVWHKSGSSDKGQLYVEARDADGVVLSTAQTSSASHTTYTQLSISMGVDPTFVTLYIELLSINSGGDGPGNTNFFDTVVAELDDTPTTAAKAQQLGAYVWGTFPSEAGEARQLGGYVFSAGEESSGLFNAYAHQLGAYAWVKGFPDVRKLRAYRFKQDDHEFYGILLGESISLHYDKLSQQWNQFSSPGYTYWRVQDACEWEGWNVAADPRSGKVWIIDPDGRLDYETTPIRSQVVGMLPHRLHDTLSLDYVTLTVSQARPAVSDGTVGISLRTSNLDELDWVEHGEVLGFDAPEPSFFNWYSMGSIEAPGIVFEITNTGYARRIDSLTAWIGGNG